MKQESKYKLEIITQDQVLLSQDVVFTVVPSASGPIGVLPGHAPLLGILNIGPLKVRDTAGAEFGVFVGRGFFMISHEGVKVVARVAEIDDQIDVERARASRDRAKEIISSGSVSGMDMERAQDALVRAKSRIKVAEKKLA